MENLENIALPQSALNLEVLSYLAILTLVILLPYLSVLLGSTLLSIMFNRKGRAYNNSKYIKFSKKLIDLVTFSKSAAFGLAIVPTLSLAFIYTQFLQNSGADVYYNMIFAIALLFSALILVFTYKYSFQLSYILNLADSRESHNSEEFKVYQDKTNSLLLKSGPLGFFLLLIAIYLIIGAMKYAGDSSSWNVDNSLFSLIFSSQAIISFLYFVSISIFVTCIAVLYLFFKPGSEYSKHKSDESEYIRNFVLKTAMIFILVQPTLFLLEIFTIPRVALSTTPFLLTIFILAILLLLSIQLYYMLKESNVRYRKGAFVLTLLLFFIISIKEQSVFDTSAQFQVKNLVASYEVYENEFKSSLGVDVAKVSGKDIFNGVCSACHNFETKIVGPPYKESLVKYDGKRDELIEFILNPTKVNPEYPAMPNQGLKPNQAEAVADYIISVYEEKYK